MVKVTIIGWYGTETIGDRAILAGIFSILSKNLGCFEVRLGSIYPFLTKRTLIEDRDFYIKCTDNANLDIKLFDSQNIAQMNQSLQWCDILIMGGGPLMGPWGLYMVEYAFCKAKKLGKKTMILGCGVGPMIKRHFEKCLVHIVENSDVTIFRDEIAANQYRAFAGNKQSEVISAIDPAVITALKFKELNPTVENPTDYIVASVRDFPMEYRIDKSIKKDEMNKRIIDILMMLHAQTGKKIKLLPMHYFAVGGDDRYFMNRVELESHESCFYVQNEPYSLEQTLMEFLSCEQAVGMRFHSVVLQTVLNGKNLVIDYTDPNKGKIGGFLHQIGAFEYYKDSYINIQTECTCRNKMIPEYKLDTAIINPLIQRYDECF